MVKIITESWVLYRCQNRIEKYYHHDGAQFFIKKFYIPKHTGLGKKNVFVIFVLQ